MLTNYIDDNCTEAERHLDVVGGLQASVETDESFEQLASEMDNLKLRSANQLYL